MTAELSKGWKHLKDIVPSADSAERTEPKMTKWRKEELTENTPTSQGPTSYSIDFNKLISKKQILFMQIDLAEVTVQLQYLFSIYSSYLQHKWTKHSIYNNNKNTLS